MTTRSDSGASRSGPLDRTRPCAPVGRSRLPPARIATRYARRVEICHVTLRDVPPLPECIQRTAESRAGLYACIASVDIFDLAREDFMNDLAGVITGQSDQRAAGGRIIVT